MVEIIKRSVVMATRDLPNGIIKGTIGTVIRVPRVNSGESAYRVIFDSHPTEAIDCALDDLGPPKSYLRIRATTAQDFQIELLTYFTRRAARERSEAAMANRQWDRREHDACAKLCDEMLAFWREVQIEPAE